MASPAQWNQWANDGIITFRCNNNGFTYSNNCSEEYLKVSIGHEETQPKLTDPGIYSLHKKANGNNGTLCDIVNEGSSITLTAPEGAIISGDDINPGFSYEKAGLRIESFEVDHHPVPNAFGYIITYQQKKVVISGDTRYMPSMSQISKDADLLIHEVAAPEAIWKRSNMIGRDPEHTKKIIDHHATPSQVGSIFKQSNIKYFKLCISKNDKVESAYQRDDLLIQRKVIMEDWGNFISSKGQILSFPKVS